MKSLVKAVALAVVLAAPVVSFAQAQPGNGPVTRAQVRNELIQLEKAGYNPARGEDPHYPADIQAAQARVAEQNALAQAPGADSSGYGSVPQGAVVSGARNAGVSPASAEEMKKLYRGS